MVQFKKEYSEDGSYEFVVVSDVAKVIVEEPKKVQLSESDFKKMTKDGINDWAAKNSFDVDTKDTKSNMIKSLIKQMK